MIVASCVRSVCLKKWSGGIVWLMNSTWQIDLMNPEHAYLYGFILADGSLYETSRNRGRLAIELSARDEDILHKLKQFIPFDAYIRYRTRNTNFKSNYKSCSLTIHSQEFRSELKRIGLPIGKKSEIVSTPVVPFSEIDFWRGMIDRDGSVGVTGKSIPYVSFTTTSEFIKK